MTLVSVPLPCQIPKACMWCMSRQPARCWRPLKPPCQRISLFFAAAVADWRVAQEAGSKMKKGPDGPPSISFTENPDILATIAALTAQRPRLVVGFAAETETVIAHAQAKLVRKGCDLIIANDVSTGTGTFGGDANAVHLVSPNGVESWPTLSKAEVAARLVGELAKRLQDGA